MQTLEVKNELKCLLKKKKKVKVKKWKWVSDKGKWLFFLWECSSYCEVSEEDGA